MDVGQIIYLQSYAVHATDSNMIGTLCTSTLPLQSSLSICTLSVYTYRKMERGDLMQL